MATDQFNVRLRDGLDVAVRVEAARRGCKPRDLIEEIIAAQPWADRAIAGTPPQDTELPFPPSDPAQRDDDPTPPSGSESADQRAGDARTPRRRGRKDRADTGAEGAKSGQGRGRARGTAQGDDPARSAAVKHPGLESGCPECGGAWVTVDNATVCEDCLTPKET